MTKSLEVHNPFLHDRFHGRTLSLTLTASWSRSAPQALLTMWKAPWQAWAILLLSSVLGGVLPFLLLFKGLEYLGAEQVGIASATELPFALLSQLRARSADVGPTHVTVRVQAPPT